MRTDDKVASAIIFGMAYTFFAILATCEGLTALINQPGELVPLPFLPLELRTMIVGALAGSVVFLFTAVSYRMFTTDGTRSAGALLRHSVHQEMPRYTWRHWVSDLAGLISGTITMVLAAPNLSLATNLSPKLTVDLLFGGIFIGLAANLVARGALMLLNWRIRAAHTSDAPVA